MYPMIDTVQTGKRIEEFMKRQGLTPRDIQEYLSLTCVQTVYRWLKGINVPSVDNLYALSQLFHVSIDDMIVGNRKVIENQERQRERLLMYIRKLEQLCAA